MQSFRTVDSNYDKIRQAFIDDETGLNNKTGLVYLLDNFLIQYERYEENISLIIFDADIKYARSSDNINQSDINLATADMLKRICRRSDLIFFLGGSFFAILTRVLNGDDMVDFSNKILKYMKNLKHNDKNIELNAKFGITFSKNGDSVDNMMERALSAIDRAKGVENNIVVNT